MFEAISGKVFNLDFIPFCLGHFLLGNDEALKYQICLLLLLLDVCQNLTWSIASRSKSLPELWICCGQDHVMAKSWQL